MKLIKKLTKNYTVVGNDILRCATLSNQAKGLYCIILSLPDEWRFSVNGLSTLSTDGKTSVTSAIKELEEHGLLMREKIKNNKGHFVVNYIITDELLKIGNNNYDFGGKSASKNVEYEKQQENTYILAENQPAENQPAENREINKIKNNKVNIYNNEKNFFSKKIPDKNEKYFFYIENELKVCTYTAYYKDNYPQRLEAWKMKNALLANNKKFISELNDSVIAYSFTSDNHFLNYLNSFSEKWKKKSTNNYKIQSTIN